MPNETDFLKKAKKSKKDEFYTQLTDIEKELRHYKEFLKEKVVLCNCDDPRVSNFFHYFSFNFDKLGLKKLVTTYYKNQNADLFSQNESEKAIYLEYSGGMNTDNVPDPEEIGIKHLTDDGDFRSKECIDLLKESDVVVTNPPFSLFRDYIKQLIQYDKKFLIIGHQNAISYKEIFKLIKENKLWLGYGFTRNMAHFINPNYEDYASDEDLILYKTYSGNEDEYPKYENYNAINVDKVKDIPMDYKGGIGVPITFIDKYNPDQFEIIALGIVGSIDFTSNKKMEIMDKSGRPTGKFTHNAKGTLYKLYNPKTDKSPAFRDCETGELYSSIYARIIIKNKKI